MLSTDDNESFGEDDSDTFSVDSLEVNTVNETRNLLKSASNKSPIQGTPMESMQLKYVQDRSSSSYIPNRTSGDSTFKRNAEDVPVKSKHKPPIESHKSTEKWLFTQPKTVQKREQESKHRYDRHLTNDLEYIEEWSGTETNTEHERCPTGEVKVVAAFRNKDSETSVENIVENPEVLGFVAVERVCRGAQSNSTVEERDPTSKVSVGKCGRYLSFEQIEYNQNRPPQNTPVTIIECASELTHTSSHESTLPNNRVRKKLDILKVPFYNGDVDLSEVKKLKELNKPVLKNKSVHVLTGEGEYRRPNRLQSQCKGVIERWRHNVKPIYEHSILATGQDKANNSSMTTISDTISKMKIQESNLSPKRVTKSVCGVSRFASPAVRTFRVQVETPPQKLFGYQRKKTPSYLEQYRVEKYGPIYVKKMPTPDGTECSVLDDSSTVASLTSELRESPATFSSPESSGDEMSFYRRVVSGELSARDGGGSGPNRLSDEYDNLRSVSQVDVHADRNNHPRRKPNYVPYSIEDYRTMLQPTKLGRLGPDMEANKEKTERLRRQREYGDLASMKNIQKIQLQKKFQPRQKSQPPLSTASRRLPPHRVSEDDCLNSSTRQHKPCSSLYETSLKSSAPTSVCERLSFNRKTPKEAKRKEQPTCTSNKPLLKMLQERHKREHELTEKLRQENLV